MCVKIEELNEDDGNGTNSAWHRVEGSQASLPDGCSTEETRWTASLESLVHSLQRAAHSPGESCSTTAKTTQLRLLLFPISFPTAQVRLLPLSRASHQEIMNMQWSQFSLRFLRWQRLKRGDESYYNLVLQSLKLWYWTNPPHAGCLWQSKEKWWFLGGRKGFTNRA
jgi:hypothetical protein